MQILLKSPRCVGFIGIDNAAIVKSRLVDGYPDRALDRILIEGGVETVPILCLHNSRQRPPSGNLP